MKQYRDMEDEALVALCHGGDTRAGETIYERYKNLVRARARPYYLPGADREDLLQEGMIGLYKAVRDYDAQSGAHFSTFADMCVRRQILSALKSAARQKHIPLNRYVSLSADAAGAQGEGALPEAADGGDPAEHYIGKERRADVERLFRELLSPFEQSAMGLYLEGCSYTEIAVRLGRTEKAVDNALQRGRKKLGARIHPGEEE